MPTTDAQGPRSRSANPLSEPAARQQEVFDTMEAAREAFFDGVTKFNRELTEFVSERIRQDIETQQELMRCRSLGELSSVQTRFFQTAIDQYSDEAKKLMRLGAEVWERSLNQRS